MDRHPHERRGDDLTSLQGARQVVALEGRHSRPEAHVGRRGVLGLQATGLLDGLDDGEPRPLQEQLARQEGTVQGPGDEDSGGHAGTCSTASRSSRPRMPPSRATSASSALPGDLAGLLEPGHTSDVGVQLPCRADHAADEHDRRDPAGLATHQAAPLAAERHGRRPSQAPAPIGRSRAAGGPWRPARPQRGRARRCSAPTWPRRPRPTSVTASPRAVNQPRSLRVPKNPPASHCPKRSGVAGPYAPRYAAMARPGAVSMSGRPVQSGQASAGRMNVTRLPWLGPWQSSPCHASGFNSVPQPERSPSATSPSPGCAATAEMSSVASQRLAIERDGDRVAQPLDPVARHAESALPAGSCPGTRAGDEGQEGAARVVAPGDAARHASPTCG